MDCLNWHYAKYAVWSVLVVVGGAAVAAIFQTEYLNALFWFAGAFVCIQVLECIERRKKIKTFEVES